VFVVTPTVFPQRRTPVGWRFPTNRMKGTYLESGKGKNKVSYVTYDLGEGYSAGHINWYNDDRVMVVFPRDLDDRIAEYAKDHPDETNPNFGGDPEKRAYDNIIAAHLIYKTYKVPENDRVGRRPPFYWYTSYANGYEEHLFAIGNGIVLHVGIAGDRKSGMVWVRHVRSKP
jgi:hypothetical protein